MISYNTKMLCLIVFTIGASGCSSGGGDSTNDPVINDPLIIVDDITNPGTTTTTEVTIGTETSDSFATPVVAVSSAQMDEYVINPLLAPIPSELASGNTADKSRRYVTNPLIN